MPYLPVRNVQSTQNAQDDAIHAAERVCSRSTHARMEAQRPREATLTRASITPLASDARTISPGPGVETAETAEAFNPRVHASPSGGVQGRSLHRVSARTASWQRSWCVHGPGRTAYKDGEDEAVDSIGLQLHPPSLPSFGLLPCAPLLELLQRPRHIAYGPGVPLVSSSLLLNCMTRSLTFDLSSRRRTSLPSIEKTASYYSGIPSISR